MRCCERCFNDDYLKEYIHQNGQLGSCDFCGSQGTHAIEAGNLENLFTRFTALYSPLQVGVNAPPGVDPDRIGDRLGNIIEDHWGIFSDGLVESDRHHDLLSEIFTANCAEEDILDAPDVNDVWIQGNLLRHSLLDRWGEIADRLKHPEQHDPLAPDLQPDDADIAAEVDILDWFEEDVGRAVVTKPADSRIFRARLGYRKQQYRDGPIPLAEMGAPPPALVVRPGRANPAGISYFYAAEDERTAVAEMRPHRGALVTVGKGRTTRELRLIDLSSGMFLKSPFECDGTHFPSLVESCELFNYLNTEFAKPLRHTDDVHEYLPTQFFAGWVKEHGYDGLRYGSAMSENGANIVLFDPNNAEITEVRLVSVESVNFTYGEYRDDD